VGVWYVMYSGVVREGGDCHGHFVVREGWLVGGGLSGVSQLSMKEPLRGKIGSRGV
jgi:hypothetical protein